MSFQDKREIKKRISYLQEQMELIDKAVYSMPILVANLQVPKVEEQFTEAIGKFNSDLKKLYGDLASINNIKY